MTISELKAKIETLDDVAKIIEDCTDHIDGAYVDLPESIEHMRNRLTGELRRLEKQSTKPSNPRQLHADAETVVGRS